MLRNGTSGATRQKAAKRKIGGARASVKRKVQIDYKHFLRALDNFDSKRPFPIMGLDYYYDGMLATIFSLAESATWEQACEQIHNYASNALQRLDRKALDHKRKKRMSVPTKCSELASIVFAGDSIGLRSTPYSILIVAASKASGTNSKQMVTYLKDIYRRIIEIDLDKFFNVTYTVGQSAESNIDLDALFSVANLHTTGVDDLNFASNIRKWIANSSNIAYKRIYAFFTYIYMIVDSYLYELSLHAKTQKNYSLTSTLFATAIIVPKEYRKFFDLTILPLQELKIKSKLDVHFV